MTDENKEVIVTVENKIPDEYKPLSPWAYFGLQILFNIPIVGFIFLIIFCFNGSNINRRNFARSYFCVLAVVLVIILLVLVLGGGAIAAYFATLGGESALIL